MNPFLQALHEKTLSIAKRYRSFESELLNALIEVEDQKAYLPLGYDSLFAYCERYLSLTRDQSYAFMAIAKKSKEIPELRTAVHERTMTFSNARKLVSVITPENKETWMERGKALSQKALEREIAFASPRAVTEKIRPMSQVEAELRVGLDSDMEKDLSRIKALLKTGSAKEVLRAIMKDYLKSHDPLEKAQRQEVARPIASSTPVSVGARRNVASRYIPRSVFHEVQRRDQGRCQFKATSGNICGSSFGVHLHHLEPWAYGGKNVVENLLTLCQRHHSYWHEKRSGA